MWDIYSPTENHCLANLPRRRFGTGKVVNRPVILIATDPACQRSLATLTVLDRLALAAHQAGVESIVVIHDDVPPPMVRCRELGIEIEFSVHPPRIVRPTLLIAGNLIVQPDDLKKVMAEGGRLCAADKALLPCGITREWSGDLDASLAAKPPVIAKDTASWVKDDLTAAQAEDALWETMRRETDSSIDRHFNRPLARPLARGLAHTPVSPNVVSVLATVVGVAAAWFISRGEPQWMILGALILQLAAVLDCADGDLARIRHRETATGKWLSFTGRRLGQLCLFAGLGVGLHQMHGQAGPWLWLGLAGVVGGVIALVVELRVQPHHPTPPAWLVHLAVQRDYTLPLLALAVVNRTEWFLWVGVILVHALWLLTVRARRTEQPGAAAGEAA